MDVINELLLQTVASPWLPLALLLVTVVDGFFPPVPSETLLVAAVAVTASAANHSTLVTIALIAAIGAIVGDNIAFWLGRRVGTTRWSWMRRPRVAAAFSHAEAALDRRAASLLLGARYIPVGRVAVNMSAGALGFSWRRFLPLSALAGLSWSLLSVAIGLFAGAWAKDQPLLSAVIGVVTALSVGIVVDRVTALRRRRSVTPHLAG